jgi:rRNA maturation protein Nop10
MKHVKYRLQRKKKVENITIHSKPFIDILSRRQPNSFPEVSTAKGCIYMLSELCPL